MAAQFIYETKGYRSGDWSAAATNLYASNGSVWNPLSTTAGSAFYRTTGGVWRRFYSGIADQSFPVVCQYSFPNRRGVVEYSFFNNGNYDIFTTEGDADSNGAWDISGAPDIADLEIRATKGTESGGSWLGSTYGSWLALSTSRGFDFRTDIDTSGYGTATVEIRHAPSLVTLATFSLEATPNFV